MNQTERIKTQEFRRIVYELKQRWGVPADLYRVTVGEPDLETGDTGTSIEKISIPQLISGGYSFMKKFQYTISYVRANSNFTYGAFFEVGDMFAVVTDVVVGDKDYIIFRGQKYNMQTINPVCEDIYLLHLRQTTGELFGQIHDVFVRSQVDVEQEVDYGL